VASLLVIGMNFANDWSHATDLSAAWLVLALAGIGVELLALGLHCALFISDNSCCLSCRHLARENSTEMASTAVLQPTACERNCTSVLDCRSSPVVLQLQSYFGLTASSATTSIAMLLVALLVFLASHDHLVFMSVVVVQIILLCINAAYYRSVLTLVTAGAIVTMSIALILSTVPVLPGFLLSIPLIMSGYWVFSNSRLAEIRNRRKFLIKRHAVEQSSLCQVLLRNMLPSAHHVELLMRDHLVVEELDSVVMLYSDIVGFTTLASRLRP